MPSRSMRIQLAAAGLLVCFSAAYFLHYFFVSPPDCGCIGKILAFEDQQNAAIFLGARNIIMTAGFISGGVWAIRRSPASEKATPPGSADCAVAGMVQKRGFTVVEVVVVIAIFSLLAAMLMPQVSGVRARVDQIKSQSNLRSHVINHTAYAGDNRDQYLYFVDRDATYTVQRWNGEAIRVYYFLTSHALWNYPMAGYGYDEDPYHPSFTPPGTTLDGNLIYRSSVTEYYYSSSFIARPNYWNPSTRLGDRSQLGPTYQTEVAFPSSKGLILDFTSYSGNADYLTPPPTRRDVLVGFVDGSARNVKRDGFLGTYPLGADELAWMSFPVMHTIDGVLGRDVR